MGNDDDGIINNEESVKSKVRRYSNRGLRNRDMGDRRGI